MCYDNTAFFRARAWIDNYNLAPDEYSREYRYLCRVYPSLPTPEEYEKDYWSYQSHLSLLRSKRIAKEVREFEDFIDTIPHVWRSKLPLKSSILFDPSKIIYVPSDQKKRISNLPNCKNPVKKNYVPGNLVTDISFSVVNDRNCYYTRYDYSCPKCGKKISFVDIFSIRFLEEEDTKEIGSFSFLELSVLPITHCSECDTPLVFKYMPTTRPLFYDIDCLKQTASYKLVQRLRHKDEAVKKIPSNKRLMPDYVSRSVSFVRSEIILAEHGYSYIVNTYECAHCHRQYIVGDLASVRKEPTFIPKSERIETVLRPWQSQRDAKTHRIILEQMEEKRSSFPTVQWGIFPICIGCGYYFHFYDLYEDEPIPTITELPNEELSFI